MIYTKLNYDCVRDVLLYLEDNLTINNSIAFPSDIKESLLLKYSKDDLLYTVKILLNKKLILGDDNFNYVTGMYTANIESLSFDGHSFLDNIRDNQVWSKSKKILSAFKSVSIEIISQVATNVIYKKLGLI